MIINEKELTLIKIFNSAKPLGRTAQAIILQMYIQQYGWISAACESELDWSDDEC